MSNKRNVKQSKTNVSDIPCRLVASCCGLVVLSGCGTHPTVTTAQQWLIEQRQARDRSRAVAPNEHERAIPAPFTPLPGEMRFRNDNPVPDVPNGNSGVEHQTLLALEDQKRSDEVSTIKEVSTEGESNEVERGGRTDEAEEKTRCQARKVARKGR